MKMEPENGKQHREEVCPSKRGKLDLATAQRDISTDWVAAYQKYFKTRAPLPDHYAFAKDMPWVE